MSEMKTDRLDRRIQGRTCHGEYDMVRKVETRHYPDAEGPVYRALEDTAYSPDTYPQHWKKV